MTDRPFRTDNQAKGQPSAMLHGLNREERTGSRHNTPSTVTFSRAKGQMFLFTLNALISHKYRELVF